MTQYKTLIEPLYEAPDDKTFVTMCEGDEPVQEVSFGHFRRLAETQALDFAAKGLCQGDCVVLVMPQGISLMAAFVGAMLLGAIPSILAYPNFKLDPAKYRMGLSGVSKNLGARLIVIDEEFPSDLLACIEGLPNGAKVVRTVGSALTAKAAELRQFCDIKADQLAFIQHSAGTTGLQKGVALTHAAVLRQLDHLVDALRITQADRIYSWLPLYHDMGLIACFMLPMVCGLPITMQSPTDWVMQPATMLKIISDNRCTLAWLPNFAFQFTARRVPCELRKRFDLSSMRMFINCSEPVRASSMDEFFSAFASCGLQPSALQTSYAMAENVFAVTQSGSAQSSTPFRAHIDSQIFRDEHRAVIVDKSAREAVEFVSSGRCLRQNEVRIVAEAGADLAEGHVGEILIRSDSLFSGYFNRPDLSASVLRDGWYWSGDLGFRIGDELFIVGRKKDLIIVAGKNIYPQDIEEIAWRHPAVHAGRAVAIGIYNPELGTEDVFVVAELSKHCDLDRAPSIEGEIASAIVAELGISVRRVLLKPPKWIVKSSAGKPARSTTLEKLFQEHQDLRVSECRRNDNRDDRRSEALEPAPAK